MFTCAIQCNDKKSGGEKYGEDTVEHGFEVKQDRITNKFDDIFSNAVLFKD